MTVHLLLYGTEGCHLCEDAARLLSETLSAYSVTVEEVDIVEDGALLARYGNRIPVLKRVGGLEELNWPFGHEDIMQLARPEQAVQN
ncbi:MAG: glutaredoxin family protein [Ectothiorhodospiraceae bacterium]|nr:glutaredoxin family protein [Paracoccaceae bacterium]MCH8506062.1 glutaredoxin family protein [Ectothiorhodospiraceae bacterium]